MILNKRNTLRTLGQTALVAGTGVFFSQGSNAKLSRDQLRAGLARFRGQSLVVASWGGLYAEAQRKALYQPFQDEFGVRIIEDAPALNPRIAAMVKSGNVTWDACSIGGYKAEALGLEGLLEPVDYNVIDSRNFVRQYVGRFGTAFMNYGMVLAYRSDVLKDSQPTSVKDLWDLKRFPGMRGLEDDPVSTLPFALQAAGVPKKDIYPLNEEKIRMAFAKLDEIKKQVIWWKQSAQAPQLLASREVVMTQAFNGRLDQLLSEGLPIKIVWDGAHLLFDSWCFPKGSKSKELAMLFVAWASQPENNVRFGNFITYGPTNSEAIPMVKKERAAAMPTSYLSEMVVIDSEWWGANWTRLVDRFNTWRLT